MEKKVVIDPKKVEYDGRRVKVIVPSEKELIKEIQEDQKRILEYLDKEIVKSNRDKAAANEQEPSL